MNQPNDIRESVLTHGHAGELHGAQRE